MTEIRLVEGDIRLPVAGWLNYSPDIDLPDPYTPMGPSLLNEIVWPVVVVREPDRTRVGFAYIWPPPREGVTVQQINRPVAEAPPGTVWGEWQGGQ